MITNKRVVKTLVMSWIGKMKIWIIELNQKFLDCNKKKEGQITKTTNKIYDCIKNKICINLKI